MSKTQKNISLFALVMINVIAIGNLRTLPFAASFGLSMISYYLIACILFFIPTCWITMELATTWPNKGGICVWVEQAFGAKWGFLVIWLQWLCNVIWYPTTLMFLAAMISDLLGIQHSHQHTIQWLMVISLFWIATYANNKGMKLSSLISIICALAGTLLPMSMIAFFALKWHWMAKPEMIQWTWHDILPHHVNWHTLPNFVAIVFGFIGIEMSAIHANEVNDPARNFPKAIIWSGVLIILSLLASSLSIAMIVPHEKLDLILGAVQAFTIFFKALHLPHLLTLMMVAMIVGSFGSLSAWLIGPSKGLAVALKNYQQFRYFNTFNASGVPTRLLILQAIIVSTLASLLYLLPEQAIYTLFTVIACQAYLMAYIIFFLAALKLRKQHPDKIRPYRIPGSNWLIHCIAIIGIISSVIFIFIGFITPELSYHNVLGYRTLLALGMLACFLPCLLKHN